MDIVQLRYPRKSHRKVVNLPKTNSKKLAELLGIIYGDGSIGNPWQLIISLNSNTDLEYSRYIVKLLEDIFFIKTSIRKRPNQNTLVIVLSSTTIVDFLVKKGAVRGNKITQTHSIPSWIQKNASFSQCFIRGLVDTDGCIYLHRHTSKGKNYIHIGLCFTNSSPKFLLQINSFIQNLGIKTSVTDHQRRIYIYNNKGVEKYLATIGTSNKRLSNKYYEWLEAKISNNKPAEEARFELA